MPVNGLLDMLFPRHLVFSGYFCIDAFHPPRNDLDRRIDLLSVWREADVYDDREQAALEWTEEVTMLADGGATEDLLDALRDEFDDHEIVDLTMTIIAINAWNRLAVPFGYESSAAPSN